MPSTPQEWAAVAKKFEELWNFPQCIGSIDGKHCVINAPMHSGSDFFNYKGTFSIVLLGAVDAEYCFLFADVGCQGRISDGGVFKNSLLSKKLAKNELNLPPDDVLPNRQKKVPFVFVADDAFPLQQHIMKPYCGTQEKGSAKRIFNYRLSRSRRVVENAFGILSSAFRVLRRPLLLDPDKATKVVLACVYLHNYLRKSDTSRNIYTPVGTFDCEEDNLLIPGAWRNDQGESSNSFLRLKNVPRKTAAYFEEIRAEYADYFTTTGKVEWQDLCA